MFIHIYRLGVTTIVPASQTDTAICNCDSRTKCLPPLGKSNFGGDMYMVNYGPFRKDSEILRYVEYGGGVHVAFCFMCICHMV